MGVALVSGPRNVTVTMPWSLLTTSSQLVAAIERKGAVPSLWQRQTCSTKGESDGLPSSKKIIAYPLEMIRYGSATLIILIGEGQSEMPPEVGERSGPAGVTRNSRGLS